MKSRFFRLGLMLLLCVILFTVISIGIVSADAAVTTLVPGERRTLYCYDSATTHINTSWNVSGSAVRIVDKRGESCIIEAVSPGTADVNGVTQSQRTINHPGYYMLHTWIPGWTDYQTETNKASYSFRVIDPNISISLPSSRSMYVGDSYDVSSLVSGDSYSRSYAGVTYSTSDSTILSVSGGVFTARKAGTVTITARTTNLSPNVSKSCKVSIKYRTATGVKLSDASRKMVVGEKYTLKGSVTPSTAKQSLSWKSSAPAVVAVSGGKLTAKKAGSATITATASNGKKNTCKITVQKAPTNVKQKFSSINLGVGESYTMKATITPSGSKTIFSWSSSNKPVAAVNSSGKITGKKTGSATITVKTANGKKATCKVTVRKAPTSVKLKYNAIKLGKGQTYTLKSSVTPSGARVKNTWSSSDKSVATVDSKGKITAKKAGTVKITCKAYNGKKDTCTLTVTPAPTSAKYSVAKLSLGLNESFLPSLTVSPSNAKPVYSYKSSQPSVVSVDSSGKLKAKKIGTATITATTYNGKKATCKITVVKAPTKLSLNKSTLKLTSHKVAALKATVPSGQASRQITYTSSDKKVATVSAVGGITAKAPGTATITAKTYNGKKATCKVTVVPPKATAIKLTESSLKLASGSAHTLVYTQSPQYAADKVTWTSSNTAVATVSAAGSVTAMATGSAVITAKIPSGASAECTVTVKSYAVSVDYDGLAYVNGSGDVYVAGDAYSDKPSTAHKKIMSNCRTVEYNGSVGAAITNNNDLYMWGSNSDGQLGDGTTISRTTPVKVMSNVRCVSIGAWNTAIVTMDNKLYMTGCYRNGADGTTKNLSYTPKQIASNIKQVQMDQNTYASNGVQGYAVLTVNDVLYTCGLSYNGDGNTTKSATFTKVLTKVASFSLGENHYAAVRTNGDLYTWGRNNSSQLGDGTSTSSEIPIKVMTGVQSAAMGRSGSMAIKTNGDLYAWGQQYETNYSGSTKPRLLLKNVSVVRLTDGAAAAITNNGELYIWGQGVDHYSSLSDTGIPTKIKSL